MGDESLHHYFALSLAALLPRYTDLAARLQDEHEHPPLLREIYPVNMTHVANFILMRCNGKAGVDARRAYYWLRKYLTHERLEYFILQHSQSVDHTFPLDIYQAREMMTAGNFYYEVTRYLNLTADELRPHFDILFQTFKVLEDPRVAPWWEDADALTREDVDTLMGYLRMAIR